MRVLHLIETLGRGGAERLLVTLLPALAQQGVEPLVGVLHGPHDLQHELEERGVRVVRLPRFHRWNLVAASRALDALCRREQVALIHAHLYFAGVYAAANRLRGGPPMVETFHNLAYDGANARNWKLALRRHLRAALLRRAAARTYGVSAAVARHYGEALRLGEVAVLPNVIDLAAIEQTRPAPRTDHRLRIVVAGRLVREKGHADLLAALAKADLPPFDLRFVGAGPLHHALAGTARTLGVDLHICGSLTHAEFLSEVAAADIVVAPSRQEGFGIAAAEAMALGRPVIASRAGGLPEVIGEAGLLVPVGDIAALRSAVGQLARNPSQAAALGRAAAARARRKFGAGPVAARLADEYRAIVADESANQPTACEG